MKTQQAAPLFQRRTPRVLLPLDPESTAPVIRVCPALGTHGAAKPGPSARPTNEAAAGLGPSRGCRFRCRLRRRCRRCVLHEGDVIIGTVACVRGGLSRGCRGGCSGGGYGGGDLKKTSWTPKTRAFTEWFPRWCVYRGVARVSYASAG